MWIPYDLRESIKAETPASSIEASKADRSERNVMVGFFVRNPITLAWEIDIRANALGDVLNETIEGMPAIIAFYGNEAGKLNEIIYRLTCRDPFAALAASRRDLDDRLARWTLQLGRGMAIAGWRLADPANDARWRCLPFRPSALDLDLETVAFVPDDMKPVFRLYQRARNASDSAWRLLNAFAVLKLWREGSPPFSRGPHQAMRTVRLDMLVHSGALTSARELENQPFAVLIETLEKVRNETLRELEAPGFHSVDAGETNASARLAPMASLADYAAREVLLLEIADRQAADMAVAS